MAGRRSGQVRSGHYSRHVKDAVMVKRTHFLPIDSGKGKGGAGACTALPIGSSASLLHRSDLFGLGTKRRMERRSACFVGSKTFTTALISYVFFITNLSAFPSHWVIIHWSLGLRHCVIAVWTCDWSDILTVQRMSKNLG